MDKLTKYRQIVKSHLNQYASFGSSDMPNVKNYLMMDTVQNRFALFIIGWYEDDYIHNLAFNIEIKDGKVWIHENLTDIDIATRLIERGVDVSDIILGFVEPYELNSSKLPTTA